MDDGPIAALREQARERGRGLLDAAPFAPVADRATVLLVSPPALIDLPAVPRSASVWVLLDPPEARALPAPYREPLAHGTPYVERMAARTVDQLELQLTVLTGYEAVIEGIQRRALETRWAIRHAEPLHDRMNRLPRLIVAAGHYPEDAAERIVRPLWLQANASVQALWVLPAGGAAALPAAGEALAALCRLACAHDEGDHPRADLLLPAARETRIGRRVQTWFDDLGAALRGDEAATRRSLAAADQVLREVAGVLGERYRDRLWLREPDAYALRAGGR